MMKFTKYLAVGVLAAMSLGFGACTDDLDVTPNDPNKQLEPANAEQWYGYFGSLYGNFLYENGLTPSGVDGGAGTWMRCHWNLQEIAADEAIISNKWNDPGYVVLNFNTWLTDNMWCFMAYQREATTSRLCTEFIAKADGALAHGVSAEEVEAWKAEAQVLRAYCYYNMIDLFGKGPWTPGTETGSTPPTYDRQQLFDAVTADLLDAINNPNLRSAADQQYGRICKESARMLLAKLYLNAEVYTGQARWEDCAAQLKAIAPTAAPLTVDYRYLFCASNDKYVSCKENGGVNEILWAIPQKVGEYETWGGTTYMTAGAYDEKAPVPVLVSLGCGKSKVNSETGYLELDGPNPWTGVRMRPELSQNLIDNGGTRKLFFGDYYQGKCMQGDAEVEWDGPFFNQGVANLDDYGLGADGYMCTKYTYTTESDYTNSAENPLLSQVCETDFPVFRLADAYLMLAECKLHGVGGISDDYFNAVRTRAGLTPISNPNADEILRERQSELYFEGHRRSDLIRFGKYTGGTYNWSWKGGILAGAAIDSYRSVYAIPYQYVPTVGQNPGYSN